ncbi:MAG: c-type cytochrome [Pseudohongiellaceae bacterium]
MKKLVLIGLPALFGLVVFGAGLAQNQAQGAEAGLIQGDAAAGQAKSALCATCHGADGNSELVINPKLAGQNFGYLMKQMEDYKSGVRNDAVMTAMIATVSDQDMQDIAAWYASQEVPPAIAQEITAENMELAETLYRAGNRELGIAACSACHSPTGKGNAPAGFPALGGQHVEYTLLQLQAFRSGERDNDLSAMMRSTVERLTDRELQALADYVAGL